MRGRHQIIGHPIGGWDLTVKKIYLPSSVEGCTERWTHPGLVIWVWPVSRCSNSSLWTIGSLCTPLSETLILVGGCGLGAWPEKLRMFPGILLLNCCSTHRTWSHPCLPDTLYNNGDFHLHQVSQILCKCKNFLYSVLIFDVCFLSVYLWLS